MLLSLVNIYFIVGLIVLVGSVFWARAYRHTDIKDWISYRSFLFKVFDIIECILIWPFILFGIIVCTSFDIFRVLMKRNK